MNDRVNLEKQPFQIFTKPAGDSCNLHCSYYYYHHEESWIENERTMLNDDKLHENYIRQRIDATAGDSVFFSWHGDEPVLAGIDFYKRAVVIRKKYLQKNKILLNGIQTNGTAF